IQAAVSQAQLEEISARLGYNAARNNLVASVKADYHAVLRASSLVEVAQSDLANAEQRLSTAEAKLRKGVIPNFDVIRAQTDVAAAKENLIQARSNVELALAQLRRTLGLDQTSMIDVTPLDTRSPTDYFEAALFAEAKRARPEILQADTEIKASERGIKLARSSYEPTLALSFGYAYTPDLA